MIFKIAKTFCCYSVSVAALCVFATIIYECHSVNTVWFNIIHQARQMSFSIWCALNIKPYRERWMLHIHWNSRCQPKNFFLKLCYTYTCTFVHLYTHQPIHVGVCCAWKRNSKSDKMNDQTRVRFFSLPIKWATMNSRCNHVSPSMRCLVTSNSPQLPFTFL